MSYNYFLCAILEDETKKEILTYGLDIKDPRLQHTTPLHNLHITVGYIGPIPEDVLPKVSACFQDLEEFSAVPLKVAGVDFFGGRSHFKRYIGLVIDDAEGHLKQIRQAASNQLEKETGLTFRGDYREFKPHITFQLLKDKLKAQERRTLIEHARHVHKKPLQFWVKSLALWYRNPQTQRYESVRDYLLR